MTAIGQLLETFSEEQQTEIFHVLGLLLAAQAPLQVEIIAELSQIEIYTLLKLLSSLDILLISQDASAIALEPLQKQNIQKEPLIERLDLKQWHARLAQWCLEIGGLTTWRFAQRESLEAQLHYAHMYAISHLCYAEQWHQLLALIDDKAYLQARIALDPSGTGLLRDLEYAYKAIDQLWPNRDDPASIARRWRYSLAKSALAEANRRLPRAFFVTLFLAGHRKLALARIALLSDAAERAHCLAEIAMAVQQTRQSEPVSELLDQVFTLVERIPNQQRRSEAWLGLAQIFLAAQQADLALVAIRKLQAELTDRPVWLTSAMVETIGTTLFANQAYQELDQLLHAAVRPQERSLLQALALRGLAQQARWAECDQLLSQSILEARALSEPHLRGRALQQFVIALLALERHQQAEDLARQIDQEWWRIQSLVLVAENWCELQPQAARVIVDELTEKFGLLALPEQATRLGLACAKCYWKLALDFEAAQIVTQTMDLLPVLRWPYDRDRTRYSLVTILLERGSLLAAQQIVPELTSLTLRMRALAGLAQAYLERHDQASAKHYLGQVVQVDDLLSLFPMLPYRLQRLYNSLSQEEKRQSDLQNELISYAQHAESAPQRDWARVCLIETYRASKELDKAAQIADMLEKPTVRKYHQRSLWRERSRDQLIEPPGITIFQYTYDRQALSVIWRCMLKQEWDHALATAHQINDQNKKLKTIIAIGIRASQSDSERTLAFFIEEALQVGTEPKSIQQVAASLLNANYFDEAEQLMDRYYDSIEPLGRDKAIAQFVGELLSKREPERALRQASRISNSTIAATTLLSHLHWLADSDQDHLIEAAKRYLADQSSSYGALQLASIYLRRGDWQTALPWLFAYADQYFSSQHTWLLKQIISSLQEERDWLILRGFVERIADPVQRFSVYSTLAWRIYTTQQKPQLYEDLLVEALKLYEQLPAELAAEGCVGLFQLLASLQRWPKALELGQKIFDHEDTRRRYAWRIVKAMFEALETLQAWDAIDELINQLPFPSEQCYALSLYAQSHAKRGDWPNVAILYNRIFAQTDQEEALQYRKQYIELLERHRRWDDMQAEIDRLPTSLAKIPYWISLAARADRLQNQELLNRIIERAYHEALAIPDQKLRDTSLRRFRSELSFKRLGDQLADYIPAISQAQGNISAQELFTHTSLERRPLQTEEELEPIWQDSPLSPREVVKTIRSNRNKPVPLNGLIDDLHWVEKCLTLMSDQYSDLGGV
jgi:hypothetical protein